MSRPGSLWPPRRSKFLVQKRTAQSAGGYRACKVYVCTDSSGGDGDGRCDVPSMRPLSMHDKLGGAGEKIGFCVESCMLMLAGILLEAKDEVNYLF